MKKKNLFQGIPENFTEEYFDDIIETTGFRLERIVSRGHVTPEGTWYDQDHDEWVMVVQGRAVIVFEQGNTEIEMGPGDHILIPAHERHRVEWTIENEDTVWLALHFRSDK